MRLNLATMRNVAHSRVNKQLPKASMQLDSSEFNHKDKGFLHCIQGKLDSSMPRQQPKVFVKEIMWRLFYKSIKTNLETGKNH